MKSYPTSVLLLAIASLAGSAAAQQYHWRYYRPGNTGIQGDFNGAIFIAPDGDPWIGGYNPSFEEGGFAKLVQAENRWINVSNVDYPVIGHPDDVGTSRVSDIVQGDNGVLWLGTWRGLLKFDPAVGPDSLVKYGPANSPLPGGLTRDVTRAPDGTIWVSAESTVWGGGGLTRFNPATGAWTHFPGRGGDKIAAQPLPAGGYRLWTTQPGFSAVEFWDSTTAAWTTLAPDQGAPAHLASLDSVDDAGNMWITRWVGDQGEETLDCMRPDGSWLSPALPAPHPQVAVAALRAFGDLQLLMVDGFADLQRFDGASWTNLGPVPHNGFIDDLDVDPAGNVWLCGSGQGGALRRDAATGAWQRYRVTNTSQFDFFNADLSIDRATGDVYACANAGSGVGGMVKFDGARWTGFSEFGYDLGGPWPFPTDNSEAVCVRAGGDVALNPLNNFTHEWNGASWAELPGGPDQVYQYAEDSLGRLWSTWHYGGLGFHENGAYTYVSPGDWFGAVQPDPSRPGTVWADLGWEILRTDGSYRFSRGLADFPELDPNADRFTGLAVGPAGEAWFGTSVHNGTGDPAGALIRLDPATGQHTILRSEDGWPFPGYSVSPKAVSPDGRVWMVYEGGDFSNPIRGLCWYDGANVGVFPAPAGGEPQWGGLPHAAIKDLEVKTIPGGYELWMSCLSRGIAVLSVTAPDCPADFNGDGFIDFFDYDDFVNCFQSAVCPGGATADVNNDGFVDFFDYDDFVAAFEAGC